MLHNAIWLDDVMRQGRWIIDSEPDLARRAEQGPSYNYLMELGMIQDAQYNKVINYVESP